MITVMKTDENLLKLTKLENRRVYLIETIGKIEMMLGTVSRETPLNIELGDMYINIFTSDPMFSDLDAFMGKLLRSYEVELQDIENKFYLVNQII